LGPLQFFDENENENENENEKLQNRDGVAQWRADVPERGGKRNAARRRRRVSGYAASLEK